MVSLRHIQASNRSRAAQPKTAVFVGATSGIGLAAIKCLLRSINGSRLFIVGRSQARSGPELFQLQAIDMGATITFIEAQVSLLKEVKRTCAAILKDTQSLDLLWFSQGGLGLRERGSLTDEGLPVDFAVSYYGRILFMRELAPLIAKSTDGRVLSVLCAGMEGRVNVADPGLRQEESYAAAGFWGAQKQGVTMVSLVMQELATQHSNVSFIHTNPGMVSTDVHEKCSAMFTGWWTPLAWLIKMLLIPFTYLVGFTPDQAGETGVFEIMDERFCNQTKKNFFRLDEHAAEVGNAGRKILEGYRKDGTAKRICEHTWDVYSDV